MNIKIGDILPTKTTTKSELSQSLSSISSPISDWVDANTWSPTTTASATSPTTSSPKPN